MLNNNMPTTTASTNLTSDSILNNENQLCVPPTFLYRQRTCTIDRPDLPDFSFLPHTEQRMLSAAYDIIHKKDDWHILTAYFGESILYTDDDRIVKVVDHIAKSYIKGHSYYTIAWTMRQLELIGLYGFTEYKHMWMNKNKKTNDNDSTTSNNSSNSSKSSDK